MRPPRGAPLRGLGPVGREEATLALRKGRRPLGEPPRPPSGALLDAVSRVRFSANVSGNMQK